MTKTRKIPSDPKIEKVDPAPEAAGPITQTSGPKTQAATDSNPKAPTKQQKLAGLLLRDEGATLDQMIAATRWLTHTTRAALTGLKKKGYSLSSDKVDGIRTYRAVAPE
ncbi:MAG: DUF3489 domain-containing protein [Sphingomicrobium sp.]